MSMATDSTQSHMSALSTVGRDGAEQGQCAGKPNDWTERSIHTMPSGEDFSASSASSSPHFLSGTPPQLLESTAPTPGAVSTAGTEGQQRGG
jgi:hypothetical protein